MLDLMDAARVGLLVLAAWFAASLIIALLWGAAGYRLNRRRELSAHALLAARDVTVPTQGRPAVSSVAPEPVVAPAIPAIPVHGLKRRSRQDSLKTTA